MDLYPIKLRYRSNPRQRAIAALARGPTLGCNHWWNWLTSQWRRTVKPKPGFTRQTFDAMGQLNPRSAAFKAQCLLGRWIFQNDLQGSLKGRDMSPNASIPRAAIDLRGGDSSLRESAFVEDAWCGFFRFSLTLPKLLTRNDHKGTGASPAITSSFLNLVMWRYEPWPLQSVSAGITYSAPGGMTW